MPDGECEIGGQTAYLKGGIARLANGTIAGAATNLYEGMKNAILFGIPEEYAVRACTYNPACSLGVQDQVGAIAPGMMADFIVCRSDYTSPRVFLGGEEI
jgi:N-acetylglucosamine-6-phosphate deacetylase